MRARHSAVRSQVVFDIKDHIRRLYDLPRDPTAIARRVDYLLERDRFMCSLRRYVVSVRFVIARPQLMCMNLTQQVPNRFLAPQIPEAIWGKYFKGKKIFGISEQDFLGPINGTIVCLTCAILCHTLRAWQAGVYLEISDFRPEAVGGEPDPEPGILSFRLGYEQDVELGRHF